LRKVQEVTIDFTHVDGDLDLKIYRLDGVLLGNNAAES
jgi:hypothetical protein